jgi:hypothetical protein
MCICQAYLVLFSSHSAVAYPNVHSYGNPFKTVSILLVDLFVFDPTAVRENPVVVLHS